QLEKTYSAGQLAALSKLPAEIIEQLSIFGLIAAEDGHYGSARQVAQRVVIVIVRKGIGTGKLAIGGKSMGGRIASQIAGAGDPNLGGLIFLGCPLHPPGKVDQLASSSIGWAGRCP